MTSSRRVLIGIAGVATALALIIIGPNDDAFGARFPGLPGGQGGQGRGQAGQDGRDGPDGRSANQQGGQQGQQGDQGDEGGNARQRDGEDGENENLDRSGLTPAQRARLQAREAKARAREQANRF